MNITFPSVGELFLWRAVLAISLSFLVGLEFHNYRRTEGQGLGFGTTRTFTLIGLLGFLLTILDTSGILFALGLLTLAAWLGLYYQRRLKEGHTSLMGVLACLLTYILGLLAADSPQWFAAAYAVLIVFLLNAKPRIRALADTLPGQEIATVAKFVIMAGIVLPLLPDRPIAAFIPVTFRDTWFAVVAISGISYLSYVLQTYILKSRGPLLTGVLGGLYSSTATTFVLGRQARKTGGDGVVAPALMLATAMMYVRLGALAAVLAPDSIGRLALPFGVAATSSVLAALLLYRARRDGTDVPPSAPSGHPLEFQMALLFAALFVVFATASQYVSTQYHEAGLQAMAFAVGFTEIDPFVLSVLSEHSSISLHAAVDAVVIATASNNLLKAGLVVGMARNRSVLPACAWLVSLALLSFVYVIF